MPMVCCSEVHFPLGWVGPAGLYRARLEVSMGKKDALVRLFSLSDNPPEGIPIWMGTVRNGGQPPTAEEALTAAKLFLMRRAFKEARVLLIICGRTQTIRVL